ncbi:TPA: phage holin family protein [Pseudomonas aeruginosa]|uniref:phage holin family protein n=1 Tax=Pseudomonas aeruginosa TaxID=287 RepID=UPI00068DF6DD|nr:phage holin family protein [Pseudomonas aeruginosa]
MLTLTSIMNIVTMLLCALTFGRLFTFQREGRRFRRLMSAAAALVMAFCGAMVIYILDGKVRMEPRLWPLVGLLAVLAVGVWRCRGNLAALLDYPQGWEGAERRKR